MSHIKELIDTLEKERTLSKEEFITLLSDYKEEDAEYAKEKAVKIARQYFDNKIYTRGLIEFTNY